MKKKQLKMIQINKIKIIMKYSSKTNNKINN